VAETIRDLLCSEPRLACMLYGRRSLRLVKEPSGSAIELANPGGQPVKLGPALSVVEGRSVFERLEEGLHFVFDQDE
jgi:hypothetical protein